MQSTIGKRYHWEMSHRLPLLEGKCKNIHGHSYHLWIEVAGETNASGMVMDYYLLDSLVLPLIEQFDHAFMCNKDDNLMVDFLKENDFKYFIIPEFSTAENIAEYILRELIKVFKAYRNVTELTIRVHETEHSYAEAKSRI